MEHECPLQCAADLLHPSSAPLFLPGREAETCALNAYLRACISHGRTGSVHVSGSPGVGKTATLARVTAELIAWAQRKGLPAPFIHNVNGYTVDIESCDLRVALAARMVEAERGGSGGGGGGGGGGVVWTDALSRPPISSHHPHVFVASVGPMRRSTGSIGATARLARLASLGFSQT